MGVTHTGMWGRIARPNRQVCDRHGTPTASKSCCFFAVQSDAIGPKPKYPDVSDLVAIRWEADIARSPGLTRLGHRGGVLDLIWEADKYPIEQARPI